MPMSKRRSWVAWSSGKDSLWALHVLRQNDDIEVTGLLTTVTGDYQRVSMHGVREELLQAQAAALGLPLYRVVIPAWCSDEVYDQAMQAAMDDARRAGVTQVAFGDLFLESVRAYREERLGRIGMEACFPLWGRDTAALAREMIDGGLRARITCLDPSKVSRDLAGREYDLSLLEGLPESVDPCGENGEFHTFAYGGPGLARPLKVHLGEVVERAGFVFADVLPG